MREIIGGFHQFEVFSGDIDGNLVQVEKALVEFAEEGCRLVVLPEMWSCGFPYPSLRTMAARTPDVLERLREWGRLHGLVLVGSLPEADGDEIFNTSYVIDKTGEIAGTYRKVHLFSLHGEDLHFGRGRSPLVCSTGAGRLGIMICYDLRFPELARRLAMDGAEILCVSALWPIARIDHWSILLRSRALENQLFVIGCNGCGREGMLQYGGASAIVSPTGAILAEAGIQENRLTAILDPEEITLFRQQIPCLSDRAPEVYGT